MTLVASTAGAQAPPPAGTWVLGVDSGGTAYLFRQGARTPSGGTATAAGLSNWVSLGTSDFQTMSTRLGTAMGQLGNLITPVQQSGLIQSSDVGSLEQGRSFIAIPASQTPGQTNPALGQAASSSEAVFSPIIPTPSLSTSTLLSGIWSFLTAPSTWVRILEYIGGAVLLYIGIHELAAGSSGLPKAGR